MSVPPEYMSLEDEARQYLHETEPSPVDGIFKETIAERAVALSTAISLRRIADSLKYLERNGLITRNRGL